MKLFNKIEKTDKKNGKHYYFGDYNEIDLAISSSYYSTEIQNIDEPLHYHLNGYEYYIVTQGSAIIEIENTEYTIDTNTTIMVEPNEKHKITRIISAPCSILAISTVKSANDKITIKNQD